MDGVCKLDKQGLKNHPLEDPFVECKSVICHGV